MAKKDNKREVNFQILSNFKGNGSDNGSSDMTKPEEMADMAMDGLEDDEQRKFLLMCTLASNGVTPDEYAEFYSFFEASANLIEGFAPSMDADDDDAALPFSGNMLRGGECAVNEYAPLKDAEAYTLVLKIQMKGVTKPPMWREVEIPADFTFGQLHEVIQSVTGLYDSHLWQFNVKAYDKALIIGIEGDDNNPYSPGLEYVTHDADETEVTQFLQKKGDKLEYVYDFGDDWIFVVEVKDLIAKRIDNAVCLKYKGDLNALEDFGGVWAYLQARKDLEDWSEYSKKERKERSENVGFESEKEYIEFLNSNLFDIEDVNDELKLL